MKTSIISSQSTAASRSLRQVMGQYPLFSFFFITYAFSWIMSIPVVLSEWGYLPASLFQLFFIIKAFAGPFVAGFIMINITEGKEGLARFRRRFVQVRTGWQWYLFILLVIPGLFILGILVQPGALASFQGFPHYSLIFYLVNYLVTFVIIFVGGGPLAEEPGWRGFALPRLQSRFGALRGDLLLGIVWAFWHLPDFLTRAQRGGPGTGWGAFLTNFPIFVLMVVALSIIMTWVYNHTRGSLFIAILLHASINTAGILPELFHAPNISSMTLGNLALLFALAVPTVLILILTRGRLGYPQCQPQPVKSGDMAA